MSLKSFPEEVAFTNSISQVILHHLDWSFQDIVGELRRIEAEFLERTGEDQEDTLEIRRRIAKEMLSAALSAEQSSEVCRAIWDEIQAYGFSNLERKYTISGMYARCCQFNGDFDAALEVIEPLIPEIEQRLDDATLDSEMRAHYEQLLPIHRKIRDELLAGHRD